MKFVVAALLIFAFTACRSARPSGSPVSPLSATSVEEATAQLRQRRAEFRGMRSLMRVRATTNGKTQSFRAQLIVHDAQRMELIAYTPVGTTALNMKADGHQVTSDPAVAPEAFAFLRETGLTPAETAMLLLGLPPRDELAVITASGVARADLGEFSAVFEPPAFPAKRVVITTGTDRIEIEHVEVVR